MTNANFTRINPADDVVVALTQIPKGSAIEGVTLLDDIPAGHAPPDRLAVSTVLPLASFSVRVSPVLVSVPV